MRQDDSIRGGEGPTVRKFEPLDELDDLGPPPPLPLIRYCGTRGCRRRARSGGRHCPACHTAAVRRWRERHRNELVVRRRDAAAFRDDQTRARDSARAKLAMALGRGKLVRGACTVCGTADVEALIGDPRRPLDVVWVCRADRPVIRERQFEAERRRAYEARQAAWYDERDHALAAIELLPPAERAELHATAARGPAGIKLSPLAPLYTENLVRVFQRREREAAGTRLAVY